MNLENFEEIIDFAIEREKEAAEFYRYMQDVVKFNNQKELLHEYELMEKSHAKALQSIKKGGVTSVEIVDKVENLLISDYVIASKPSAEMSYQDIIIIAMKREEAAYRLYSNLEQKMSDEKLKRIFMKLAQEELKHKLHFEKIYDSEFFQEN